MEIEINSANANELNNKPHEVTLILYRPYKQQVTIEAKDGDEAIELAFTSIDYTKFTPCANLDSCEVELYEISPNDWDEEE